MNQIDMTPLPFDENSENFCIPQWSSLNSNSEVFSSAQMSRHFMIIGETGSGKTISGILPVLKSALEPRALEPAMLIVDPKQELHYYINRYVNSHDRVVKVGDQSGNRISFFEGIPRDELTSHDIVNRLGDIFQSSSKRGQDLFWDLQAKLFLERLINIELTLYRKGLNFAEEFRKAACIKDDEGNDKYIIDNINDINVEISKENYFSFIKSLTLLMLTSRWKCFDTLANLVRNCDLSLDNTVEFENYKNMADGTFGSIIPYVTNMLDYITDPSVNESICFYPHENTDNLISIEQSISDGKIIIYSHYFNNQKIDSIIAKAVKKNFFEACLRRSNKERSVFYFCDEFQRFVTGDEQTGEQSFLDRCRAYRVICVLATQSISSLKYTLLQQVEQGAEESVNIIMTNTGNKLFFRNTDPDIQNRLQELVPTPSMAGKRHVADVRPVSTLLVGECYYLMSNGSWGRQRVKKLAETIDSN